MPDLSVDAFMPGLGEAYEVEAGAEVYNLTLIEAEALSGSSRTGGSFRLLFGGPRDPVLPQAIYPFRREGSCFDLFIVPIGQDQTGTRYEAIFN